MDSLALKDDDLFGLFHDEWMGRCDISYWKFGGSFQLVILVSGWWFQIFLIFTPTWGRFPFWLIFVKWVETTNQYQFSGAYWCHCETPKKSSIHVAPGPWKSHIPTHIPAALPRDEMRQQVRSEKVELYKERGFQCGSEKTITRCMVVLNICYVHPYLGKISNLTSIFQLGWNHQPE